MSWYLSLYLNETEFRMMPGRDKDWFHSNHAMTTDHFLSFGGPDLPLTSHLHLPKCIPYRYRYRGIGYKQNRTYIPEISIFVCKEKKYSLGPKIIERKNEIDCFQLININVMQLFETIGTIKRKSKFIQFHIQMYSI